MNSAKAPPPSSPPPIDSQSDRQLQSTKRRESKLKRGWWWWWYFRFFCYCWCGHRTWRRGDVITSTAITCRQTHTEKRQSFSFSSNSPKPNTHHSAWFAVIGKKREKGSDTTDKDKDDDEEEERLKKRQREVAKRVPSHHKHQQQTRLHYSAGNHGQAVRTNPPALSLGSFPRQRVCVCLSSDT